MSMYAFASEGILIPFYHYPSFNDAKIDRLIKLKREYPKVPVYVIINPNNGHFRKIEYNFAYAIKRLHDANFSVIGYVHTSYCKRPFKEVAADIKSWSKIYKPWGVKGVFVDEVNGSKECFDYYKKIAKEIKKVFDLVIFNPGTKSDESIAKLADITVVYESNQSINLCKSTEQKSAVLLHGIKDFSKSMQKIKDIEYIYITPHTFPNPWGEISDYLENTLQILEKEQHCFK